MRRYRALRVLVLALLSVATGCNQRSQTQATANPTVTPSDTPTAAQAASASAGEVEIIVSNEYLVGHHFKSGDKLKFQTLDDTTGAYDLSFPKAGQYPPACKNPPATKIRVTSASPYICEVNPDASGGPFYYKIDRPTSATLTKKGKPIPFNVTSCKLCN